ncbi:uncharacterized protein LOC123902276 isoform X2 [Trifolium pratense]|uniref:uncharacterized protein LOC123902276 isoform X2 n=1 Tax=Trifolium pratense TaxID=57577 RepID=UPI001E69364A|nr:uncharacterized protein LOC123902276 isoform X2 [Trifolium pratense]
MNIYCLFLLISSPKSQLILLFISFLFVAKVSVSISSPKLISSPKSQLILLLSLIEGNVILVFISTKRSSFLFPILFSQAAVSIPYSNSAFLLIKTFVVAYIRESILQEEDK